MDVKAAPNGVATIEDRILRITGYYGYYPGYSSQKSKTPRGLPCSRRRSGWDAGRRASGHLQPCLLGKCQSSGNVATGAESMSSVLGAEP